jgi:putative N-acetyltransferase (TIGR04045 family)
MSAGVSDGTETRIICRVARAAWEVDAYHRLRRDIFCEEQRVFEGDDRDEWDAIAVAIVAVGMDAQQNETVVGVVRIYEPSPGLWYGGRLGVHAAYRSVGHVGRSLVVKAVTTAHAWGCREFLAIVQAQNVAFFRRLRWRVVEAIEAHGRPHSKMVADLAHYPPSTDADVALRPEATRHDAA